MKLVEMSFFHHFFCITLRFLDKLTPDIHTTLVDRNTHFLLIFWGFALLLDVSLTGEFATKSKTVFAQLKNFHIYLNCMI